jgi:hypothetical protein
MKSGNFKTWYVSVLVVSSIHILEKYPPPPPTTSGKTSAQSSGAGGEGCTVEENVCKRRMKKQEGKRKKMNEKEHTRNAQGGSKGKKFYRRCMVGGEKYKKSSLFLTDKLPYENASK